MTLKPGSKKRRAFVKAWKSRVVVAYIRWLWSPSLSVSGKRPGMVVAQRMIHCRLASSQKSSGAHTFFALGSWAMIST